MRKHLERVNVLHQNDLDWGYAGTILVGLLEEKYKNAAKAHVPCDGAVIYV